MRNNIIYELGVYAGNKRIFSFRDSLHLLPGKLGSLAESLCPGLGRKGSFAHENVTVKNVGEMKDSVLKYAKSLGYTVIPLSGYLFEKKESPFKEYVNYHFESRLQAKKDGNEALSFVYKILMNSLYGRFGIHPNSTKTELCDSERYHFLMKQDSFIGCRPIKENQYMVSYHTVTADDSFHWAQPKNSAVQLSAAITACARIYMHPFISRDDCYYTDTDSIVLANPLPDNIISSKVLGLFKLEDKIKEGFFLAPKAYGYISEEDTDVIKFKGAAKHLVDLPWFREQLANPSRRMQVKIKNQFTVDWDNLTVGVKEYDYSLGIKLTSKRITQPDGETLPIEVNDMCWVDHNIGKAVAKSLMKKLMKLQTTNQILNEKLSDAN